MLPRSRIKPSCSNFTVPTDVKAELTGLQAGTNYHYRLVAANSTGSGDGDDQTFATVQPPSIDGLKTSALTATTADLDAKINPNGADTHCHFEYGATTAYGSIAPCPNEEDIGEGETESLSAFTSPAWKPTLFITFGPLPPTNGALRKAKIRPLTSFPQLPQRTVRQQTGSEFLPDCRAYELVSPEKAGNVVLFPPPRLLPHMPPIRPALLLTGGSAGSKAQIQRTA